MIDDQELEAVSPAAGGSVDLCLTSPIRTLNLPVDRCAWTPIAANTPHVEHIYTCQSCAKQILRLPEGIIPLTLVRLYFFSLDDPARTSSLHIWSHNT